MKTIEELKNLTLKELYEEKLYVPEYTARYIETLEAIAVSNDSTYSKNSAIKSLIDLANFTDYNKLISESIREKIDIPSIFV